MKSFLLLFALIFLFFACNDTESTREEEYQHLQQLRAELFAEIESITCESANEWTFIGIGAKACGGPLEFIPYPISLESFLDKASSYTAQSDAFNRKWGVTSDCALVAAPTGVACNDGIAELVF